MVFLPIFFPIFQHLCQFIQLWKISPFSTTIFRFGGSSPSPGGRPCYMLQIRRHNQYWNKEENSALKFTRILVLWARPAFWRKVRGQEERVRKRIKNRQSQGLFPRTLYYCRKSNLFLYFSSDLLKIFFVLLEICIKLAIFHRVFRVDIWKFL